jgi:hypothetical protein
MHTSYQSTKYIPHLQIVDKGNPTPTHTIKHITLTIMNSIILKDHHWIRWIVILSIIDATNATNRGPPSWCMLVSRSFVVHFKCTSLDLFLRDKSHQNHMHQLGFPVTLPYNSLGPMKDYSLVRARSALYRISSLAVQGTFKCLIRLSCTSV